MVIAIKCIQLMFLQAQVFPLGMSNICDCLCPKVTLPYKNCRWESELFLIFSVFM